MNKHCNIVDVVSFNKKLSSPYFNDGHVIETQLINISLADFFKIFYQKEIFSINKCLFLGQTNLETQQLLDLITFNKQNKKLQNFEGNGYTYEPMNIKGCNK